jgi:hypothetical protein
MEITKTFKERVPASRLIGKRYGDADRENGGFGHKWGEFFRENWFAALEAAGCRNDFDYLGMMRCRDAEFEYWIGMLADPGVEAPPGFAAVEVESFEAAVFWLYGKEDTGELFGLEAHNRCLELLAQQGFKPAEDGWCIERYNCPRFLEKDAQGKVVLDYYIEVV